MPVSLLRLTATELNYMNDGDVDRALRPNTKTNDPTRTRMAPFKTEKPVYQVPGNMSICAAISDDE